MKKTIILAITAITSVLSFSQEKTIYNQYFKNFYYFNPAYSLGEDKGRIQASSRFTPVDNGNNRYSAILYYMYYDPVTNFGFGAYLVNDNDIITDNHSYSLTLGGNYSMDLGDDSYLRFGADVSFYSITNKDKDKNTFTADADIGIWYQMQGFYAGISSYNLNRSRIYLEKSPNQMSNQFFIMTGYEHELSEKVNITPSLFYYRVANRNGIFETNTMLEFSNVVELGGTLRFSPSRTIINYPFSLFAGVKPKEIFQLMFSIDLTRFNTGAFLNNNYELSFIFDIK